MLPKQNDENRPDPPSTAGGPEQEEESAAAAADDDEEEEGPAHQASENGSNDNNNNIVELNNGDDYVLSLPPPPPPAYDVSRTESTRIRLSDQGFRESPNSGTAGGGKGGFAVRSIPRGSVEWRNLLRPFVADIVFRSLVERRRHHHSKVTFRPYTCKAVVLFVDLSNYSKITAAVAHKGAHTLSGIVNAYLARLLDIVQRYGGDVVKFAGDAVLIVWEEGEDEDDLDINLLTAARCAMDMQEQAGSHPVEIIGGDGEDEGSSGATTTSTAASQQLHFRLHAGLCCGHLESEVFVAPGLNHMQRLYHIVGGECLVDIAELVNIARAGQICVSDDVAERLGTRGRYDPTQEGYQGCKILRQLVLEQPVLDEIESHVQSSILARGMMRRHKRIIEEDFIHPSVIGLLSHGGLSPTQISQMRHLCLLFVAMTSNGSSVNWLMEVQSILDKNRCPIVQIIDDDKGVHLVCAVNLYESIPESSLLGLEVCRELVEQQVGCAIGMASGPTFCGVVGSSSVACRWDLTGPPPVRAARLMQHALEKEVEVAIDQSVYDDPAAATRMEILEQGILLKGTKQPIPVYKLSDSKTSAAFRVLDTVFGRVHNEVAEQIRTHISGSRRRVAVIVTGIPLAGKKIVCQRAAGCANLVPYLHLSDASAGFLQLASTIATWFRYVDESGVRVLAGEVLEHMSKNHWSMAHDRCIDLVDAALSKGLRACFLIDRVQFLDEFSLSLLRECLHGVSKRRRLTSTRLSFSTNSECDSIDQSDRSSRHSDIDRVLNPLDTGLGGKICFLCVHVSLYDWRSASEMAADITRSQGSLRVPIIQLGEAKREELRVMFRDLSDMEVEERWLDAYSESSGFCAGYFIERAAAIRVLSGKLWKEGKRAYAETTTELVLHIPFGLVHLNRRLPVRRVSVEIAMRFNQVFDELPPLYQTTAKVLTMACRTGFFKPPVRLVWNVLNDLIAKGVEEDAYDIAVDEMTEMCLLKIERTDGTDCLSFLCPALADTAFDVSTPIQIRSIGNKLIQRLVRYLDTDFRVPFVTANLQHLLGKKEGLQELWRRGYGVFCEASSAWDECTVNKWKESIDGEIRASGYSPCDVLGVDFSSIFPAREVVGKRLPLVKIYSAPVSLGPMGHSLSVITRNTFHEFGVFHGYSGEAATKLRDASRSAARRYLAEMDIVEGFLSSHGFAEKVEALEKERDMIRYMSEPAGSDEDVQKKAATILDDFVPNFVTTRLQRLYQLVDQLRKGEIPSVILRADKAIRRAYEALRARDCCRTDAAQDALMILATSNWKPRPVPEYLPLLHYQTVARLRSKTLKRLSEAEFFIYKHQQTYHDLEAFLVVTALLHESGVADEVKNAIQYPLEKKF